VKVPKLFELKQAIHAGFGIIKRKEVIFLVNLRVVIIFQIGRRNIVCFDEEGNNFLLGISYNPFFAMCPKFIYDSG
jgi:hypothetical protein